MKNSLTSITPPLNIATWNIRGKIDNPQVAETIIEDFKKYNIKIACIQETFSSELKIEHRYGTIINLHRESNRSRGIGFFLSSDMFKYYWDSCRISDRIGVLRLLTNPNRQCRRNNIVIINVYAPTVPLANKNPEELEHFYNDLNKTVELYKKKSRLVIVMGDFNAKVGIRKNVDDTFIGNFGLGKINDNGVNLINFAIHHKLFLANTNFQHKACHRTTWHNTTSFSHPVHNIIDYIIIPQNMKEILIDSRTRNGTTHGSDHSLLLAKLDLSCFHIIVSKTSKKYSKPSLSKEFKYNINSIRDDPKLQDKYTKVLNNKLNNIVCSNSLLDEMTSDDSKSPQECISMVQAAMVESAMAVGSGASRGPEPRDAQLRWLSQRQLLRAPGPGPSSADPEEPLAQADQEENARTYGYAL
jgi:exonuclease III